MTFVFIIGVECGALTLINANFSSPSGTVYPNEATIACFTGYELAGQATVTTQCAANGSWTISEDCTGNYLLESLFRLQDLLEDIPNL